MAFVKAQLLCLNSNYYRSANFRVLLVGHRSVYNFVKLTHLDRSWRHSATACMHVSLCLINTMFTL